ncbi:restriction endonuclease [Shouchella plakortidis]|uniref:Restriction endonuclease n=1 Tax=Alkalicoccobacillus plakortidis TaxID=444060 RepID=A0ABT0XF80_9BACI|nr:restriction endonuclease [Alkalicoccobacillus plakortidis]MCM2674551.1 restriction endonuclease [Alkalicoccobacillus plakortidis]
MSKKNSKLTDEFIRSLAILLIAVIVFSESYRILAIIALVLTLVVPTAYHSIRDVLETKRLQKSGMPQIDQMNGFQFEYYLQALFFGLGYKPSVTKRSYDFGADLILDGKNRIVIQAKCYGEKNKVGIDAVQQIYAAKTYYKAQEAWVLTNRSFSPSAIKLAECCNVKLLDRMELQHFILKIHPDGAIANSQVVHHPLTPAPLTSSKTCEKCGYAMQRRIGKRGEFLGAPLIQSVDILSRF